MIIFQPNPNFNNEAHLSDTRSWDAFPDYANALRDAAGHFPARWRWCTATATTSRSTSAERPQKVA